MATRRGVGLLVVRGIVAFIIVAFCIQMWLWTLLMDKQENEILLSTKNVNNKLQHQQPEIFLERLNRLLPENESTRRLSIKEIEKIEHELLHFYIPRNVTVQMPKDADYVAMQIYRWLFRDQKNEQQHQRCPRCHLRFDNWPQRYKGIQDDTNDWYRNSHYADDGIADVKMDLGCPNAKPRASFREADWQVLIGGCGEALDSKGGRNYAKVRAGFDYHAGFEKMVGQGLFQITFAHLHLSPDKGRFGFPELWTVTDMVRLMLRQRPRQQQQQAGSSVPVITEEPEPAMFTHNNCGGPRGSLLLAMTRREPPVVVARYGQCLHNKETPNATKPYETKHCTNDDISDVLFHGDCEATRDGMKTVLSAHHKFTFSLENTFSEDYITEKRWQAMLGGSIPIVWDNHNSLDSLPDPNAALIVPHEQANSVNKLAPKLIQQLVEYTNTTSSTADSFFEWKQMGLRVPFVRKLFLSSDYLICRVCEYVANNHKREGFENAI